jgi:hypothetical protein
MSPKSTTNKMDEHPSYEEGGVKMVWDPERRAYFPEVWLDIEAHLMIMITWKLF